MAAQGKKRTVLYVFEDGDKHKGDLKRMCLTDGIEPEFAAKKLPPLQAADLLAWRTRNPLEEGLKPTLTREKAEGLLDTFSAAWKKFKHEAFYGDKEMLERLCVERGINPRR